VRNTSSVLKRDGPPKNSGQDSPYNSASPSWGGKSQICERIMGTMSITLSKKDWNYVFKAAWGKTYRKTMHEKLKEILHGLGPNWERCVDELSQGHRTVILAWTALTLRVILTSSIVGPDHASIIGDTFRACLELKIIGSEFARVRREASEEVVTFLDHIAARLDQKHAIDAAWEQATPQVC
jgi:hypothetical protein